MAIETGERPLSQEEERPFVKEAGFEIEGRRYAIPRLDTITLDEERVLYLYADTVLQDFSFPDPNLPEDEQLIIEASQGRRLRNPDFKRALAHIAYKREHPDVKDSEIQLQIGKTNALEVDHAMLHAMLRGDDDDPPALSSQKQPESKSDTSAPSRIKASGSPTENDSDPAGESPAPTGTTESGTSSLVSAPSE